MSARGSRLALAAVGVSLLAALFFTTTYVLNRAIANGGGHWAWSAALRYFFTLPLLLALMPWQGGVAPVHAAIRAHPMAWLRWSAVGFVLFCCTLTFAADTAPAWLVAGSFQLTVIAGMLLAPLLYSDARRRIPARALGLGTLVFGGVLLMQFGHFSGGLDAAAWIALLAVVVSAFAYPLGNRKLLLHLEASGESLNATQRVYGLTLTSQPLWWLVALHAFLQAGWPSLQQMLLAGGVALGSGVIATVLFFLATGWVRNNPTALGAVEAMQGAEILFATALGALVLGEAWPHGLALCGSALVLVGIVALGWLAGKQGAGDDARTRALRSDRCG